MKTRAGLLALWIFLLALGIGLSSERSERFANTGVARQEGDILLDVFGEFRTILARYLWFKMDLFHEVLDDQGVEDNQQVEVLPLLRMVSLLDPTLTDAYDIIAWDLYKGHRQAAQSLAILDEGLERNPTSFQLNFRRSLIAYQDKQYQAALDSGLKATESAIDEFDKLNAQRMVYWSAKQVGDKDTQRAALAVIRQMRPGESRWVSEQAELDKADSSSTRG